MTSALDHRTVDLLARLVAFDTESRRANVELIEHCASRCEDAGAVVTVLPGAPGRANLLARFGPDRPGGLFVSGHTDVVPAGSGWATDPYQLTEREGTLRGRGTADMKGFVAVALALLTDSTDGSRLRAPVHVGLSYDEEIGCVGVRGLLDHLRSLDRISPDLVVVGEPTLMQACGAHAGKVSFEIEVTAPSGHSSRAGTVPSAISVAAELVRVIDDLPTAWAHGVVPVDDGRSGEVTANVGTIEGGAAVNVLAPRCVLTFELRHRAGVPVDDALAPVWEAVERLRVEQGPQGVTITVRPLASYPALATRAGAAPVEALRALVGGTLGTVGFGTEGGLYADCLPAPVVVCGPGSIEDAHRPDEFVDPTQLVRCHDVLGQLVAIHCGG